MKRFLVFSFLSIFLWSGCHQSTRNFEAILPSPGFDIHLYFNLFNGHPYYMLYHYDQKVLEWSALGFIPEDGTPLNEQLVMTGRVTRHLEPDGEEALPEYVGQQKYNSLYINLESTLQPDQGYAMEFRVFRGGMAFRYHFPSASLKEQVAGYEHSEFIFSQTDPVGESSTLHDSLGGLQASFPLPFELVNSNGYHMTILGEPSDTSHLRLKASLETPFKLVTQVDDEAGHVATENALTGPWRVILISKTESNE